MISEGSAAHTDGRDRAEGASEEDRLHTTLDYVRESIPFYSANADEHRYQVLGDFPILDSSIVAQSLHRLYYLEEFPDFIATSGGTVAREKKVLIRNYAELDAAFLECASVAGGDLARDEIQSFTLNLTDFQHGLTLPPRHGQRVLSVPLESGRQLSVVEDLLREGLMLKANRIGASRIIGSSTKLRALTAYCASIDPGFVFHVHEVISTSFYCSKKWCDQIRSYWGADLRTAYGLSEFPEVTTIACPACGLYHLPRTVHAEVLAFDHDIAVVDQPGRLVLTSLLPFRRAMPLIRYDTGDIVQLRSTPFCSSSDYGIEFYGRASCTLLNSDRTEVLLSPFDVIDIAEEIMGADLVRSPEVENAMQLGVDAVSPDYSAVGYPAILIEQEYQNEAKGCFRVIVECRDLAAGYETMLHDAMNHLCRMRGGELGQTIDVLLFEAGGLAERGWSPTLI